MNLPIKLLGSLAVAGMVAAGGTAFTATGITRTAVDASRQIGGVVSQTVDGAVMSAVDYTSDVDGKVTKVTVTLAAPIAATSTITLDAFSNSGLTVALGPTTINSDITPSGASAGSVYVFELDTALEGDGLGTTALRGIKVTVVGNNS
jgi:hypothetical protein